MTGFVFVALFCLLALFWPTLRRHHRLRQWRQSLSLPHHSERFNALYQGVDGFALSRQSRLNQDALEFVYGEIEFEPFIALLSLCQITDKTVFYDLGSGIGKAVLACAMVYSPKRSCGIEWFAGLHQTAESLRCQLQTWPDYTESAQHVEFRQGDFLEADLRDATLIFINATAFFGDYWRALSHHLDQLKPGTRVISTSKALHSTQFNVSRKTTLTMSWGTVTAYFQDKL